MEQHELAAATAAMLRILQEQLAAPGARSEILGPMQTAMLRGYIVEYVALHHDPVLEGVLREFPERPTLPDAVTVLQQMVRGRPYPTGAAPGVGDASRPDVVSEFAGKLLGAASRLRAEVEQRVRQVPSPTPDPGPDRGPRITPPDAPERPALAVQHPTSPGVTTGATFAADALEAERRLWLSTIVQTRGTIFDNDAPRRASEIPGLVRSRRGIGVLNVGLAAAVGAGAPAGLFSIPSWTGEEWGVFIFFTVIVMLAFEVELPLVQRWANKRRAKRGLRPMIYPQPHDHPFHRRGLRSFLVASAISLALESAWHVAGHGTSRLTLVAVVPLVAAVTWSWMVGTESGRREAAVLGARSGVIAGCVLGFLVAAISGPQGLVFRTMLISALRGGVVGFAGGLALDRGWAGEPRGMLKTLVAASLLWWLLVLPFFASQLPGVAGFVGGTLAAAGFGAGWAIGVSDWQLRSPLMSLALRRIPLTEPPAAT